MTTTHIKKIKQPTKIDIVIPAAGLGKRMKSYGPKSLIKVKGDRTILDNQLKIFKKYLPNANIILVCGFQSNVLMNKSPDNLIKIENENYETTNVLRSIGMGLRACSHDVLVVYGDLIFNDYCIANMNFNKSSMLTGDGLMDQSEVGCIANRKGVIENMMYDLDNKWGQITFFKGRELKMFKEVCWNPDHYNMFGFEAINRVISQGGNFLGCGHKRAKVIDIDTSKDLERVSEII